MGVDAIGGNQAAYMAMAAQKGSSESRESAAQEQAESPAVQAAEGEKGGTINTYA